MHLITSSLRTQLLAGFAVVTLVFAIGAVIAIHSLASVTGTLQSGSHRMKLADQLSIDTYDMQGSELMNTLQRGRSARDHAGDVQRFQAGLASVGHSLQTAADRRAYAAILRAFDVWTGSNARTMGLAAAHPAAAIAVVTGAGNQATDALSAAAARLSSLITAEDRRDAASSRDSATLLSIALGVVAILLAIAIAMLLSWRIVGGVRQMLSAAKALARGDVEQHVNVAGHDEIAAMGLALSGLIEYLRATAGAAEELASGNFTVEIEPRSDRDALSHAFIEMRDRVGAVVRAISGTSDDAQLHPASRWPRPPRRSVARSMTSPARSGAWPPVPRSRFARSRRHAPSAKRSRPPAASRRRPRPRRRR